MCVYILFSFPQEESSSVYDTHSSVTGTSKLKAAESSPLHRGKSPTARQSGEREYLGTCSPPVQLFHLLDGVGSLQDLGGGGSGGPLPRRGSVHMIHVEDPAVAVNARLPV